MVDVLALPADRVCFLRPCEWTKWHKPSRKVKYWPGRVNTYFWNVRKNLSRKGNTDIKPRYLLFIFRSRPVAPVERTVLDRLRDMLDGDVQRTFKVRDRARHF
jgi:hypothetical protein